MTGGRTLDAASRVVAAREQLSCEVDGEIVILNLADDVYYVLDLVGARVWALLDEPRTVAELRDAVAAEYDVDPETAERDILDLLEDMAGRRLVEVVD